MFRKFLSFALILCLLCGSAAVAETQSPEPTEEIPEGALANGSVDSAGESDVAQLQESLIELGLLTGEADGHFGDRRDLQ